MNFTVQATQPLAQHNPLTISPSDSPQVIKLKKAAYQFEGMLLAKWWSSMKDSGLGEQDDSTDPGHDTLDDMGIQAMSGAVASRGGLGIGAMLVRSLLSNAEGTSDGKASAASPKPQS
jgi:Rod binding domain-containing protein